jgi:hypothetical protein
VHSAAASRIHLLQYSGAWSTWLQQHQDGRQGALPPDPHAADSRGYTPVPSGRGQDELPHTAVCEASECSQGLAALSRTIAAARRHGAKYVLANVPEHAERWRDPIQYRAYLDLLISFAQQHGVPFLDVSDGDPSQFASDKDYVDMCHMTPSGSARFTSMLAPALAPVVGQTADLVAGTHH